MVFATGMDDGLSLIEEQHFVLYLIDESLPDGSGTALARQIRAVDSITPLVFHFASAFAGDVRRGLDAGAQAYITKPSNPDEVTRVLDALIAESEKNRRPPEHQA